MEKFEPGPKQEQREKQESMEKIKSYFRKHVVDVKPGWEGGKELKKSVAGGLMGAAETKILRCNPNLEIPKLSFIGGKSIALIGPNGSGKSTLFDAFMGKEDIAFSGGIYGHNKGVHGKESLRIARLNQEEVLSDVKELKVEEVLSLATEHFEQEFPVDWENADAFEQNLINQDAGQRIEELMSRVENLFEINMFKGRKVGELSGGEKTKLSLLMLLVSEPDVLFLDEPTNHLDLESVAKLTALFEKYKQAGVSVVNVSHVEWFLEMAGQDGTVEIKFNDKQRTVISSGSPYKNYIKKEPETNLIQNDIKWNKEYVQKNGQPLFQQSSVETISVPKSPLKNIKLPAVQVGDLVVFSGKNGTGKTKLMEELADKKSKIVKKDKGIQIAYMPQFWPDEIAKGTVGEFFLWIKNNTNPHSNKQESRFVKELRDLGFSYSDKNVLNKKLSSLSGGEQRLLWFAAASIFEGTDALILDEPTNHLDGATMKRVLNAIRNFDGAIILSTHDLRLMKELEKYAGKTREGRGIRNVVFDRNENDSTTIKESKQGPAGYAGAVMEKAKKEAGRIKVN